MDTKTMTRAVVAELAAEWKPLPINPEVDAQLWHLFQRADHGWWLRVAIQYNGGGEFVDAERYLAKWMGGGCVFLPYPGSRTTTDTDELREWLR